MFAKLKKSLGPGYMDAITRASTMGLHLVSGILVGTLLGYGIDHWLDSAPWGFFIGLLLGIAAGFNNVYIDARLLIKAQESGTAPAGLAESAGPEAKTDSSPGPIAKQDDGPARGQ